jgi:hypothetical protein
MNVIARWSMTALIAVGLGIDAYNHLHVAHNYAMNKTSTISEATLFRLEAGLAIAAAVLVIVWANRWTAALALAVAGGGLVLLVLYRYHDVGRVGPLPDMYEPSWAVPGKKWSVAGEAIAIAGSLGLLSTTWFRARRAPR